MEKKSFLSLSYPVLSISSSLQEVFQSYQSSNRVKVKQIRVRDPAQYSVVQLILLAK